MGTGTKQLVLVLAITVAGCYEGEVDPVASPLRLISSTPKQNEPQASLVGDITLTLSESLLAASVSGETVQLIPAVAGAGDTGHSMGAGTMSSMSSSLISLLGTDYTDNSMQPGTTIKGLVRPGVNDKTIVFTPIFQLMAGMTYEIALHGLTLKTGRIVSDHFVPLTFTTASTVATRLVNKEANKTSTLKFEADGHTVSLYPGQFPRGTDIPPGLAAEKVTKHDSLLLGATSFIANPVDSLTYVPASTLKTYTANILNGGTKVLASATFDGAGPNNIWGDSDDLISSYTETLGNLQKTFIAPPGASSPFSNLTDTTKFSPHDTSVMVYDPVNARSLLKHIRFNGKNANALADAQKQANAPAGAVLPPAVGSVLDYHDYRYGAGVTNNGKLLVRLRAYPAPDHAAFSSTDTIRYCREYSYNAKGQLDKVSDYSYSPEQLIPGAVETCPAADKRVLLLYTTTEYDSTTAATVKMTTKRPAKPSATEGPTDIEMYIVYFEPQTMTMATGTGGTHGH